MSSDSGKKRLKIRNKLKIFGKKGSKIIDFYKFSKHVLQYDDLGYEHKNWADSLIQAVNDRDLHKIVLLKPRGTYKSTFYTVSLPIWLLLDNPNLRILIVNAVGENAKRFLKEITGHYLKNERLNDIYRQLGYTGSPVDPNSTLTTSIRLTNATKVSKEPSIAVAGYGSSLVSQHYDVIIVDDLCDRDDREYSTIREGKKRWFSDIASLLNPNGLLLVVGTRWHFDDVYNHIINELNPKHKDRDKYHVEIEGAYLPDGSARYPRILSEEKLEELRIDKTTSEFAANYLNNPLPAETQVFKLENMEFVDGKYIDYEVQRGNMKLFGWCDPSLAKPKGDYTAIVTVAVDRQGFIYVYDAYVDRITPDRIKESILQNCQQHRYVKFGIESNQFQQLFVDDVKKESRKRKIYASIEGINHSTNKQSRIESIQPLTYNAESEGATVKFRDDWQAVYPQLIEQLLRFPLNSEHDDAPDALEGAISLARESAVGDVEPVLIGGGGF